MIEIHITRRSLAGGFLGTSAGEKRAMEHGHLHFSSVIGNSDGEEAGIFVIHVDEIDALIRIKGREPNRFQWNKSSDTARAIRGPWDENAA